MKEFPTTWTVAVFKRLQARYGSKWIAALEGVEDVAVVEWSRGLAGYSGIEIKRGLDEWQGVWPPTLPEFAAACKGKILGQNEYGLSYTPEIYRHRERSPAKLLSSGDREIQRNKAREHMGALHTALKIKPVQGAA